MSSRWAPPGGSRSWPTSSTCSTTRSVTSYDQNTQLTYPNVNPDFGKPVNSLLSGTPPQFQAPRNIRLGVRFEF